MNKINKKTNHTISKTKKFISDSWKSSSKYIIFISIQSLIFTFLYNFHLFKAPGWGQLICPFFALTNTIMGFYIIYLYFPISAIVIPIIYLMSSIGSYYHNTYNIDINHSSIAFLFETHYFEAIEFINTTNSLWILLSLFIALFWIFFIKLKPLKKPHYAFSAFFLSFFIIINFGIFDSTFRVDPF